MKERKEIMKSTITATTTIKRKRKKYKVAAAVFVDRYCCYCARFA